MITLNLNIPLTIPKDVDERLMNGTHTDSDMECLVAAWMDVMMDGEDRNRARRVMKRSDK